MASSIIFSISLRGTEVRLMGRLFPGLFFSPFLNIALTLAFLQIAGKILLFNDFWNMIFSGSIRRSMVSFKNLAGCYRVPDFFPAFKTDSTLSTAVEYSFFLFFW